MVADLLKCLNSEYDISAVSLKPFGPVWQVSSAQGCFALKKANGPKEELEQRSDLLYKIKAAGFDSITAPLFNKKKLPYFTFNDRYYQLFHWHQGEHPSFTDPGLIQKCVRLFGKLHRISQSIIKPEDCRTQSCYQTLEKRTAFLEHTILTLKNTKPLNRIDRTILKWGNYFLDQARYSLAGLAAAPQSSSRNQPVGFCHNDPASRNIIIKNTQWFLIDFDLAACDFLIKESAKLVSRILKDNRWNFSIFQVVLAAYTQERKLSEWENFVLPYLLYYPQQFWRFCSQRFEEKLKWSERHFASKIREICDTEQLRFRFLQSLPKTFLF